MEPSAEYNLTVDVMGMLYTTPSVEDLLTETTAAVAHMLNGSSASNSSSVPVTPARPLGRMFVLIVKVVYAIGIVGNACAIIALRRGERRVRNRKHLLLLTSLAANDLVALVST